MKLLPMLLLNLATVVVAIVVYDQLRTEPAPQNEGGVESSGTDAAALERRVAALEAERRPTLQATGTDPRVLERLDALEAPATAAPDERDAAPGPVGRPTPVDPPFAFADEPTADDVRRFRKLQAAVKRDEQRQKNAARIDRALDKLSLRLSTQQRAQLVESFTNFQPRVQEIWGEVKAQAQETMAAGGTVDRGEIVSTTSALIQDEFAQTLSNIVPQADAEAVAKALMPGGR